MTPSTRKVIVSAVLSLLTIESTIAAQSSLTNINNVYVLLVGLFDIAEQMLTPTSEILTALHSVIHGQVTVILLRKICKTSILQT